MFSATYLGGVLPYYIYIAMRKLCKSQGVSLGGLVLAGFAGSMTNTLLVMNLIFVFFRDAYASVNGIGANAVYGFILGIIGMNGIPEAIIAAVITLLTGRVLMKQGVRERLNV